MSEGFEWQGDLANDEFVERKTGLRVSNYDLEQLRHRDRTVCLNHLAMIVLQQRLRQKMKDDKPQFYDSPLLLLLEE